MIKQCLRIALRELPNHIESRRHWSFIIQKGRIVEWAKNRLGEPTGMYFAGYQPGRHALHAEINALSKAKGLMDLRKPWSLINIRLTAQGQLVMSAPCPVCTGFMRACGCREFIYSDSHGRFVKILPENFQPQETK
jgi:tRNA(Arg) A34 adenosine deaminase TadA